LVPFIDITYGTSCGHSHPLSAARNRELLKLQLEKTADESKYELAINLTAKTLGLHAGDTTRAFRRVIE
jgi:hypothetical protein